MPEKQEPVLLLLQMKASVGELMALVGGTGKGNIASAGSSSKSAMQPVHHSIAAPTPVVKHVDVPKTKEVSPDKIIPMDDDFKDF